MSVRIRESRAKTTAHGIVDLVEYRRRRSAEACGGPEFEALDPLETAKMAFAKGMACLEAHNGPDAS